MSSAANNVTSQAIRFEGHLKFWNGERGYGAIDSLNGGDELFVHFSAFPLDGPPPTVGEALSFEVVSGSDGRKQAARVLRSRRCVAAPTPEQRRFAAPSPRRAVLEVRRQQRRRRIGFAMAGVVLSVAALAALNLGKPVDKVHQFAQKVNGATTKVR